MPATQSKQNAQDLGARVNSRQTTLALGRVALPNAVDIVPILQSGVKDSGGMDL